MGKYNTGHGIPAIPDEVYEEIRRLPDKPEAQQGAIVYLLLESTLEWDGAVIGPPLPPAVAW